MGREGKGRRQGRRKEVREERKERKDRRKRRKLREEWKRENPNCHFILKSKIRRNEIHRKQEATWFLMYKVGGFQFHT